MLSILALLCVLESSAISLFQQRADLMLLCLFAVMLAPFPLPHIIIPMSTSLLETCFDTDAKSMVMDAFNKAYLDNDMTGQDEIFLENAVARVNGQEMSPAEMIEAFMGGREFYNDIKNINPSTSTFIYDDGAIYTSTWFTWEGISKSTGVTVNNPVHAYFRWEGD